MNRILRQLTHTLRARLPHRPVEITVAGERYTIDSSCRLRGEVSDYDYAWVRLLGTGKRCVLDVGSNVGVTALLFARHMAPDGVCVLFDPSVSALSVAARNLARSGGLTRASFANVFVGASGNPAAARTHALAEGSDLPGVLGAIRGFAAPAPWVTLDDFCRERSLAPDLVKIDVEGAEGDVLAGMKDVARRHGPAVQVELHSFPPLTMRANADGVLAWCREVGYVAWYLKEHAAIASADPIAHRGRCHLVLLPEGQPYPPGLREIPQGEQYE